MPENPNRQYDGMSEEDIYLVEWLHAKHAREDKEKWLRKIRNASIVVAVLGVIILLSQFIAPDTFSLEEPTSQPVPTRRRPPLPTIIPTRVALEIPYFTDQIAPDKEKLINESSILLSEIHPDGSETAICSGTLVSPSNPAQAFANRILTSVGCARDVNLEVRQLTATLSDGRKYRIDSSDAQSQRLPLLPKLTFRGIENLKLPASPLGSLNSVKVGDKLATTSKELPNNPFGVLITENKTTKGYVHLGGINGIDLMGQGETPAEGACLFDLKPDKPTCVAVITTIFYEEGLIKLFLREETPFQDKINLSYTNAYFLADQVK